MNGGPVFVEVFEGNIWEPFEVHSDLDARYTKGFSGQRRELVRSRWLAEALMVLTLIVDSGVIAEKLLLKLVINALVARCSVSRHVCRMRTECARRHRGRSHL